MALVNCSVYNVTTSKIALPWSIYSTEIPGVSVQEFYLAKLSCEVKRKYPSDEAELDFASLGKSKELLDRIELTLPLDMAIQTFGPFLRYYLKSINNSQIPVRNAFAIMMSSQRQLSSTNAT